MARFKALQTSETDGRFETSLIERDTNDLPAGEVLIRVSFSSLNYKDALSASGNRGVTRNFPHTPGIDAAGTVAESSVSDFAEGDEVIVTGYDLGMNTSAGLTAALCIDKLGQAGLEPTDLPILVTGATGGVGSIAIALLSKLGYKVAAVTGKAEQGDFLRKLGATEIVERSALQAGTEKPLLKEQWAGAVDTVGGDILFNAVKSLRRGGSVACCGLTAGTNFQASVLPFILRGVNLLGVDSVEIPLVVKASMWDKLSVQWKLPNLDDLVQEISLDQLPEAIERTLAGQQTGRILVRLD